MSQTETKISTKMNEIINIIEEYKIFFKNKYKYKYDHSSKQNQKGKFVDMEKDILKYQVTVYKNVFNKICCLIDDKDLHIDLDLDISMQKQSKVALVLMKSSQLQVKNNALDHNLKLLQAKNKSLTQQIKQNYNKKSFCFCANTTTTTKQCSCSIVQHNQLLKINQKITKQLQIYKRKADQFDKFGGRCGFQKNVKKIKDLKDECQRQEHQKAKMKDKIMQLTKKCQILFQLNQQTQVKLAQSMIAHQNVNDHSKRCQQSQTVKYKSKNHLRKISQHKAQQDFMTLATLANKQKQNYSHFSNLSLKVKDQHLQGQDQNKIKQIKSINSNNIEVLSLKEQLKQAKRQIQSLSVKNKELIKKCHQKEAFFARMSQNSY